MLHTIRLLINWKWKVSIKHETTNSRNGLRGPTCITSARVWSFELHSKLTNRCIYIHLSFCVQRCRSLLSISKRSNYVLLRIYSRSVKTLLHTVVCFLQFKLHRVFSATRFITLPLLSFYCSPVYYGLVKPPFAAFKNLALRAFRHRYLFCFILEICS